MKRGVLRLLLSGYSLAAAVGLALWLQGAGLLAVAATLWLGGPVATVALGFTPGAFGRWLRPNTTTFDSHTAEDDDFNDALEAWERDRANDRSSARRAS